MGVQAVRTAVRLTLALLGGIALAGATTQAAASDDWDWGAVEAMDDAPVVRESTVSSVDDKLKSLPANRTAENAIPDFSVPAKPALALFEGLPPFEVIPSKRDTDMHPCANCHRWVKGNPEPRKLKTPHDNFELQHGLHGKGKFWCFTCHDLDKGDELKTLEGEPVAFADAYIVCSQCHAQQAHEWAHGTHGKRVGNWQGPRQVLNCTACHYQHRPAFKPREPLPGPKMRAGLQRPDHWVAADQRDAHRARHAEGWRSDVQRRREAGDHGHAPGMPETTPGTAVNEAPGQPDEAS